MSNSKGIFGDLIEFHTQKDMDQFVDSMDKKSALKIIELALMYIQRQGDFTLEESHILYKSISKIKEDDKESGVRDDDNHGDIG